VCCDASSDDEFALPGEEAGQVIPQRFTGEVGMRTLAAMAVGATALLMAASCTDQKVLTEPGHGGVAPTTPLHSGGVTGAAFTTTNPDVDATNGVTEADLCKNGNPAVNCNIYGSKSYVWLNGGPAVAYVGAGTYFFAVLQPGGQPDPNDGSAKNLSDQTADPWPVGSDNADGSARPSGDDMGSRTFTVDASGQVSYGGPHDFSGNKIRLMPYDDTPNHGGVYIMAICYLGPEGGTLATTVTPSKCKYDAFKVKQAECVDCGGGGQAEDLTVLKDADGSDTKTWKWTIEKAVDKTKITALNGTATFNYTVTVSHDGGTISDVKVTGTISVFNPNVDDLDNIVPVGSVSIEDKLSDGTVCVVNGGTDTGLELADFENTFGYTCDLGSTLPAGSLDNTVKVTWDAQTLGNGNALSAGSAQFGFSDIVFTEDQVDESIEVTDTFDGTKTTLGTVTVDDDNPTEFEYSHEVPIPSSGCHTYDNTAAFTTNDTETTGSDDASVQACRVPPSTGALTIGFWQNKNGQGIISGQAKTGTCASATWLRQYAPFQDLSATAKCADVATYVYNVIKAANASGASMNAMLKAQMLATALDVYFSDPALGGNKIKAPSPIGGILIDLTVICKSIGSCNGSYENVSGAFGGATSLTVSQMLSYAASQSNVGGSSWYGQVKSVQELAKDAFDAINNEVAFQAP
jgi:hypothetical protein